MDKNDEFMHPPGKERAWSESYYFNFVDPEKKIGLFTRMGFRINEGWADGLHVLFLGGDRLAFTYSRSELKAGDKHLKIGGLGLECLKPFEHWIIRYQGPAQDISDGSILMMRSKERPEGWYRAAELEMELEFQSQAEPYYDSSGARGHFEQTGKIFAEIRLGMEKWIAKGWGVRDKSWGPRDWKPGTGPDLTDPRKNETGPKPFVTWFSANFESDKAFGCSCFCQSDGTIRGSGWFQDQGKNQPLRDILIESQYRDDSILHKSMQVSGTTEDGRKRIITGQVMTICPTKIALPDGATFINEGLTQFSLEGQVGYGISEYWNSVQK